MTKRPTTTAAATALKIKGELVLDGNTGLPLTPYEQGGVKVYPAGDFSPYGETVGVAADMTTPTPAQIEAAIEAFCKSTGYPMEAKYAEGSNLKRDLTAALTAAAEVGEPYPLTPEERRIITDTIERCARVADEHQKSKNPYDIAAAIRALKDKP